mmetsp:Transcript_9346/g.29139  ORF Transcript_9346/g.29139 Transcript_9346/m.29139 type:complete len:232 (-) Transcript_9346:464-1159(-)
MPPTKSSNERIWRAVSSKPHATSRAAPSSPSLISLGTSWPSEARVASQSEPHVASVDWPESAARWSISSVARTTPSAAAAERAIVAGPVSRCLAAPSPNPVPSTASSMVSAARDIAARQRACGPSSRARAWACEYAPALRTMSHIAASVSAARVAVSIACVSPLSAARSAASEGSATRLTKAITAAPGGGADIRFMNSSSSVPPATYMASSLSVPAAAAASPLTMPAASLS